MEGHCSTGQSPQWAVVPMEEEEEEYILHYIFYTLLPTASEDIEICSGMCILPSPRIVLLYIN